MRVNICVHTYNMCIYIYIHTHTRIDTPRKTPNQQSSQRCHSKSIHGTNNMACAKAKSCKKWVSHPRSHPESDEQQELCWHSRDLRKVCATSSPSTFWTSCSLDATDSTWMGRRASLVEKKRPGNGTASKPAASRSA